MSKGTPKDRLSVGATITPFLQRSIDGKRWWSAFANDGGCWTWTLQPEEEDGFYPPARDGERWRKEPTK